MKKIIILLFLIVNNISNAQFTSNLFSIVHNFNSGNQINRIATINADSGLVTNISNQTIDGTFYLTSSAFNASGNKLYYISNNSSIVAFDSSDGTISQTPLINFYNGISYFDNVNFCISNNTLYGLFRPFDSNFNSNGIFFAKADLQTGNVTVISQGSIASNYQVAGTVIDPKLMVYYFKTGSKFLGIDLYNGSIYSNPDVIYTNGDFDFANFSYNCEDNTIYGLVREMTTIQNPNAPEGVNLQYMRFAKIDPVTGVVVRISNVPLPTSFYSANAGSTINPNDNLFYYSDSEKLYGISLLTGLVEVEELLIKNTGDVINFLNNLNYKIIHVSYNNMFLAEYNQYLEEHNDKKFKIIINNE
ncbi:MAG: hypothetical protein K2P85_00770 [Flavobacteriaceae bacterium]|nr:hypothetical protein [Flavobacteriaceae bacterium]